jgi:SIR2-like domain
MKLLHPVVLLLGAGATRGALRNKSLPPPVDSDFFEIAGQIKGHGTPGLARTVLSDVWKLYGRVSGIGLENYYRDIETREKISSFAKTANKPKDWRKRKIALEELIRRVIIHTTCVSNDGRLDPLRSKVHGRILADLEDGDSIVTFNYDMLIEESFRSAQLWTPVGGYGDRFHGVRGGWCRNWLAKRKPANPQRPKIRLLKLHGSVNWRLYKTGEVRLKDRPFVVRSRGSSPVFETVSILPPGLNKRIDKNPYKKLWREARLRFERCKTIVIAGYSLPDADVLAKGLFNEVVRLRAARKQFLKELHLADPNDSVKQRFVELFVPALNAQSKIFRYSGIEEFAPGHSKLIK